MHPFLPPRHHGPVMSTLVTGAGQAWVHAAVSPRQRGYDKRVVVVGAEHATPCQRPPASEGFAVGSSGEDPLWLRPAPSYEQEHIAPGTGTRVVSMDLDRREVTTRRERISWENAVLAGASARVLALPRDDLAGVSWLRTLSDADALARQRAVARRTVVIGGGSISLDLTAELSARGIRTTLLESAGRLARSVTAPTAAFLTDSHTAMGTDVRFGVAATAILRRNGEVAGVRDTAGELHEGNLVVVAIGAVPRTHLASAAGLRADDGIIVDECLQTSDKQVFAIGDCARLPHESGVAVRPASVPSALDQSRHVAEQIALNHREPSASYPWFWSDQGATLLRIAGLSGGHGETVTPGDPPGGAVSVSAQRDDHTVAVESINHIADHEAARTLWHTGGRPASRRPDLSWVRPAGCRQHLQRRRRPWPGEARGMVPSQDRA